METVLIEKILNDAFRLSSYILRSKYDYGLITFDSFYIYNIYLGKLRRYLGTASEDSFDRVLTSIVDWNPDGSKAIANALKTLITTMMFVAKES
ncbi:hypothetical protein D4R42_03980 [bacterium]|nr:MAG: hypothetical protein D4R42_03980 [bacterium]